MFRKLSLLSIVATLLLTGASCINISGGGTAAAGPMGTFRSSDKGETWQQTNALPTATGVVSVAGVRVYKLFTDPSDPNAIYMGSRGNGLYYTYDRGDTWHQADQLKGLFIYSVAVDPANKCVIYVTDGARIAKSVDCNRSWKVVYTDLNSRGIRSITIDPFQSQNVYASLLSGDVIKSGDAGAGWRVIKTFNNSLQYITMDPLTPGRIYVAGVDSGLARSDDNGATWHGLTGGLQNYNDSLYFYRLILHPKKRDTLYWLSKYGILISRDAGQSWTDLKLLSPPGSVNIYSFGVNPNNDKEMYYVGTILGENASSRSTFYKTTDGGNNWVTKKMPTNTVPVSLLVHPDDNAVLFMGFTVPDAPK